MELAGVPIAASTTLELAAMLREAGFTDTAEALEAAFRSGSTEVELTIADRDAILRTLDDPPHSLTELRAVLLHDLGSP